MDLSHLLPDTWDQTDPDYPQRKSEPLAPRWSHCQQVTAYLFTHLFIHFEVLGIKPKALHTLSKVSTLSCCPSSLAVRLNPGTSGPGTHARKGHTILTRLAGVSQEGK